MTFETGLLLGAACGALIALPLAWFAVHRSARRARLAERRARNAERMAEIGAMTGGLAHEIKNPLSTIGLNAQLLGESIGDLPVPPHERERLTRRVGALRREVDRLRDILEGFLRFAGTLRLETAPHDLNAIVEELADFYLPQAQRHGVRLRLELAPAPVIAPVDAAQLKQALLNLMINATQAMADPSWPGASAAPQPASNGHELILRTEAARAERGSVARIHTIDTGPGVAPETIERIFTPYFTTKSGGTGLGLPICRRIIEAHGGAIDIVNLPGRGADFVITLPRA